MLKFYISQLKSWGLNEKNAIVEFQLDRITKTDTFLSSGPRRTDYETCMHYFMCNSKKQDHKALFKIFLYVYWTV